LFPEELGLRGEAVLEDGGVTYIKEKSERERFLKSNEKNHEIPPNVARLDVIGRSGNTGRERT